MRVIATAGHVDHGKSTLVKALTGQEPDRWQAERDRGLTIDLGFVWTDLPNPGSAETQTVAFVDVPGHQRFIGNMLAGLGPCPAVMFVVAADEGWARQSQEHLAAIDALGVASGVLVITKCDLADPGPARAAALERIAASSLQLTDTVEVAAPSGTGIVELRKVLGRFAAELPVPDVQARVRLWIDRSFSIKGAGTVVTGTLSQGRICLGDELQLRDRRVRVRGLQSLDVRQDVVAAPARVALNLADVAVAEVGRGDVLMTPGAWRTTSVLDVRLHPVSASPDTGRHRAAEALPEQLMLHAGTAAEQVRLRRLAEDITRITLPQALPLAAGDRAILRNPGTQHIVAGLVVVDADPPPLTRRGAGRRRAEALQVADGSLQLVREVSRRGAVTRHDLLTLGFTEQELAPVAGVHAVGQWLVADEQWRRWAEALSAAVQTQARLDPLLPSLTVEAARAAAGIAARELLADVAREAGLEVRAGRVHADVAPSFGRAEPGLAAIEARLAETPWAAPERTELEAAGLGAKELAAAVQAGRLIRLPGDVVLLPDGPARAMRVLAGLPQPFTLSAARQALGSTRRVVVPLLEHLDERGWTKRVDGSLRVVVR